MIEGESEGDSVTDAALLRAHVAGDPDAFTTLVTRHQDRLWTIVIRIMRNPEDAATLCKMPIYPRFVSPAAIAATLR